MSQGYHGLMRKLLWTICGLHCVTLAFAADISYSSFQRGSAYFHLIRPNLNHETVSAETRYTSKLTSIGNLWADDVPVAAITGTFFAWENQKPVAEVTVDGNLMCPGRRGSLIAIDWFGKAHILHPGYRQELDWFPFRYGLRGSSGSALTAAGGGPVRSRRGRRRSARCARPASTRYRHGGDPAHPAAGCRAPRGCRSGRGRTTPLPRSGRR